MARKVPGVRLEGSVWRATAYDPQKGAKVRVKNPRTGSTAFDTQEAAIQAKEAFEREKLRPQARVWTADEWVAEWTTNPGYNAGKQETTVRHNAERVSKFGEDFKGIPLNDIDRITARAWALENAQRASAVRAMINDALADGVVNRNVFAGLKMKRSRGRKDINPLTKDEVDTLIELGYDMFPDWQVMGALLTTASYAGLRIGELCGLKWSDILWEDGQIYVQRQYRHRTGDIALPKSGEKRKVVMLEPVEEALRDLPRLNTEGYVFYGRRDHKRYSPPSHAYFWGPVRAGFHAGLSAERKEQIPVGFDFHELRHFCGSYLADIGLGPQDIAFQLGHTDGGKLAQEIYVHTYEDNASARIRKAFRRARDDKRGREAS